MRRAVLAAIVGTALMAVGWVSVGEAPKEAPTAESAGVAYLAPAAPLPTYQPAALFPEAGGDTQWGAGVAPPATYPLREHDPLYAYVYDPGFELPRPAPAPQAQVMAATGALTEGEARATLTAAGWPLELHDQALAIAHCESRHRPDAVGDHGSSRGWFQLWTGWFPAAGYALDDWADPVTNAAVALYVYDVRGRWGGGGGWSCAALVGLY